MLVYENQITQACQINWHPTLSKVVDSQLKWFANFGLMLFLGGLLLLDLDLVLGSQFVALPPTCNGVIMPRCRWSSALLTWAVSRSLSLHCHLVSREIRYHVIILPSSCITLTLYCVAYVTSTSCISMLRYRMLLVFGLMRLNVLRRWIVIGRILNLVWPFPGNIWPGQYLPR